jgi:hypothetical protein
MTVVGSQAGSHIFPRDHKNKKWYHSLDKISWHNPAPKEVQMDEPKTLTVPEAGRRYFGLGRNASYEAARRGDLPTIKIGRLLRVSVVALERKLERAGDDHRD